MQPEAFKQNLLTSEIKDVYRSFLLGSDVWFFRNRGSNQGEHYAQYDNFKVYMSRTLNIHTNDIAIVGSAKLGFSLAPEKDFRPFNSESDIDIVIVSNDIFKRSWDAFLELQQKCYLRDYQGICRNIFRRFVSLKEPDTRSPFFDEWSRKVEPCKKDLQTVFDIPNEINYRIYDSWDSVEKYHCKGLAEIKKKLEKKNETTY